MDDERFFRHPGRDGFRNAVANLPQHRLILVHVIASLAFAAWVIARLGGWTGYYGKPGPQVMRRGLDDFRRIKFGATLSLKDV